MTRGGLRIDPARWPEMATAERDPKRSTASGLQGLVLPLSIFPICVVRQTVVQSIGNAAWTTITQDVTDIDNHAGMGLAAQADLANEQIVCRFPGVYGLFGRVHFAASASANYRFARLLVNAAPMGESGPLAPGTGHAARVGCHDIAALVQGDTVKLQGFQDSGGNLNTSVTTVQSKLWIVWMGVL